jgi:hypothetical protein
MTACLDDCKLAVFVIAHLPVPMRLRVLQVRCRMAQADIIMCMSVVSCPCAGSAHGTVRSASHCAVLLPAPVALQLLALLCSW